jgi:hypothetical protein
MQECTVLRHKCTVMLAFLKSSNTNVLALVALYLHDETKQHNHVVSVQT